MRQDDKLPRDDNLSHDDKLPYAVERLDDMPLLGWKLRRDGNGSIIRVWGDCPACHGPAFGPVLRDPPSLMVLGGKTLDFLVATGVVLAVCACGRTHGEESEPGCGRSWFVPVEEAS